MVDGEGNEESLTRVVFMSLAVWIVSRQDTVRFSFDIVSIQHYIL